MRTHTTNGSIEIDYADSSVYFVLNFIAVLTNSPVHAGLHRAYEGTFALATSNAGTVPNRLRDVEDPLGCKQILTDVLWAGVVFFFGKVEGAIQ